VSRRLDRLGGQIQEEISDIIARKLKDPRVGFVSVTGVRVSADLSVASVYVSAMGEEEEAGRSLAGLEGAAAYIRQELGRRLRIKRIPELRFFRDDSAAKGARIDELLRDLREEKDERSTGEDS
jgi:ribosome-binding factor A